MTVSIGLPQVLSPRDGHESTSVSVAERQTPGREKEVQVLTKEGKMGKSKSLEAQDYRLFDFNRQPGNLASSLNLNISLRINSKLWISQ